MVAIANFKRETLLHAVQVLYTEVARAPEKVTLRDLAAKSMFMAPRGGSPTPRAPTQPGIPAAAEGESAPLPQAPSFPTPEPKRMFTTGSAEAPPRPEP